ncbi:uncharacterized protein DUF2529 [Bacillus oleivorans]|uniref:Uncharacterized protein DUF2529 n=1 Tax=Bacillus oleivorans TaxID=1448271 RepID=A0A285CIV5_9BACI|nr:DUF2529 family protein [Bacillus oleivorans]SNX66938.1 uncharacterized protein DUF2529 [Bacillus oleivorans]
MNKMFTTQLTGLFQRLSTEENGFLFEDAARLLAQAPAGQGSIYIYGEQELKAVTAEALYGVEPLQTAKELSEHQLDEITHADRIWLFSRSSEDPAVQRFIAAFTKADIPFVLVANKGTDEEAVPVGNVFIDLKVAKGLMPDESGNRFGFPTGITALFIYHHIHFLIREFLEEE